MSSQLHFKIIGNGQPLVLLHGWGWNSAIWQPIIDDLSHYFQLYLIDLPGFGKSTVLPASYTIEAVSALICDITPEQAIWLGWSLGGMIAWWTAINHPQKVKKLITLASSPKFVAEGSWPGVTRDTLARFSQRLISNPDQTLVEFLELQLRGSKLKMDCSLHSHGAYDNSALLKSLHLLETLDLRNDLHKLQCPSTHIFGSHDALVPKAMVDTLQKMLPNNSRCEIIHRTGHMPFLTHPEFLLNQLLL